MMFIAQKMVPQASCIAHSQFNVLNILPHQLPRTILSIENVFGKKGKKEKNKRREKSKEKKGGIISDVSNSGLDYRLVDRVRG